MAGWNLEPSWTPREEINNGLAFSSLDDVSAEDFNKLVENMQYLYRAGGAVELNAYPIGAVYVSKENISPAELFGGDWERIQDTFLLAAGDTYTAGSEGGAVGHTHGINNIWANMYILSDSAGERGQGVIVMGAKDVGGWKAPMKYVLQDNKTLKRNEVGTNLKTYTQATSIGGNLGTASHMPPYKSYYMWERIG